MSLPEIVVVPHPSLREKLTDVTVFDQDLADLAATMIAVMHKANGVGLAANQIDRPVRMFVYGFDEAQPVNGVAGTPVEPTAVVNPVITPIGNQTNEDEEGCLSIPNLYGPVVRASRIRLQAVDVTGKPIDRELRDYEARVVQHETDHLNGVLFLDKVSNPTKLRRT